MEGFIISLDAQEDLRGIFDGGLCHGHRLEPALQGGILLNVFAVFVKGGGADHLDLSTAQSRFQNIGGIHAALCVTGTHQVVDLIDKEDHIAVSLHLVHQALDPALKLAPELSARHQGGQIQQLDLLIPQSGRDLPSGNPQSQALCHGGLAHAGLADQTGVVLGPAGENLHHPLDLFLSADDVVQLAGPGLGCQVCAEVLNVLALLLVEALLLLLDTGAVAPVLTGLAPKHLVHRHGGRSAGSEQSILFLVRARVTVHIHQLSHLCGSCFQLLIGDTHFFHNIVHRLDAQFLSADKAQPLRVLPADAVGDKHHCRTFFTTCTHQHGTSILSLQDSAGHNHWPAGSSFLPEAHSSQPRKFIIPFNHCRIMKK